MKVPITLNESSQIDRRGDVSVWPSIEELMGWIEPIDVENEEYFAFDAEGRRLRLYVQDGQVKMVAMEVAPSYRDVLRNLLIESLSTLSGDVSLHNKNLEELVELGLRHLRYY